MQLKLHADCARFVHRLRGATSRPIGAKLRNILWKFGGEYRNRTGVHGFAIRCVATPPTRQAVAFIKQYRGALQGV